ncbi:hypothetical protein GUITHDRAFT_150560 [Guillardia theta CCMP2712]|uniref:Uncharacterized protein n=2 Tax=Guillardia theta TaxID=55529 RepID=L1JV63_GUITC|nr:hypothetical protein GUITHDRAFT_150560 [Guillardia theta CCMP2712]EKX52461.1 hypothetical protein GUITHDRAFT_150560 [Guillardia theta CCMP2712]|eukprot:XP_005839441.1 hypothetical protein GUITHDRAFT_150560 [Guillardia theta CCMP2712]
MPDRYPFDETKGGHKWQVWEGETTSEAIREPNVFDHGTGLHAINLGEHAIEGKPFKEFKPEKNVYDNLVPEDKADIPPDTKDASPEWGRTVASLEEDQNVFDKEQFPDY